MFTLERFKLELANQKYFTDEEYEVFLDENNLNPGEVYDKKSMQRNLLFAVIDVLEAVANDVDIMRSISTEFADRGSAYKYIEQRIQQVKDKIASLPDEEEERPSAFSLMYSRGGSKTFGGYVGSIPSNRIKNLN